MATILTAALLFYVLGGAAWAAYWGTEWSFEREFGPSKEKRHAARMVTLTLLWPVALTTKLPAFFRQIDDDAKESDR